MESPQPPRPAVSVFGPTHSEKVFPEVQRDPPVFQRVPVASGPGTGHHWEEPGSIYFALSLQSLVPLRVPSLASPHCVPVSLALSSPALDTRL